MSHGASFPRAGQVMCDTRRGAWRYLLFLSTSSCSGGEAGGQRSQMRCCHPQIKQSFWAVLLQVLLLRIIEKDLGGHLL